MGQGRGGSKGEAANPAEARIEMRDLTASSVESIRLELKKLLSEGIQVLEMDFSHVRMVDSTGIGLLIQTHNSLHHHGGGLKITHADDEVRELFRCMRLDQRFQMDAPGRHP